MQFHTIGNLVIGAWQNFPLKTLSQGAVKYEDE